MGLCRSHDEDDDITIYQHPEHSSEGLSVMFVYIRAGSKVTCIRDVLLRDGYLPVVGEVGKDLQLEPAIWFKTLIIDSILIDCDKRVVRWGKSKSTESHVERHMSGSHLEISLPLEPDNIVDTHQLRKSIFNDAECYDFDPKPDELFDTSRDLLEQSLAKRVDDVSLKQEILRLIHCIILPAIYFTKDDIPALHHALQVIERTLKGIDGDIMAKDRGILLTESSLQNQRNTIIRNESFTSEVYLLKCSPEFLCLILKHIEKDVEVKMTELEEVQDLVNSLKRKSQLGSEEKQTLSDLRKTRDAAHEDFLKFQEIRETLKNVLVRPKRASHGNQQKFKHVQPNVFHEIYMEIVSRLTNEKEQIHKLCLRKVKISSVRESILLALDELKSEDRSVGYQTVINDTVCVTDVGESGKPEEWLTLEEKVCAILKKESSVPANLHGKFCTRIVDKIRGRLEEEKLFLPLTESVDVRERSTSDGYIEIQMRNEESHNSEENMHAVASRRSTHPFLSLVETIKYDVLEHSKSMVETLLQNLFKEAVEAGKIDKNIYNKVWTAYQLHLHYRIIKVIEELYETAFKDISSNMYERMKNLTLSELGMDEPWLNSVLEGSVVTEVKAYYTPPTQSTEVKDEDTTMVKRPIEAEFSNEIQRTGSLSHFLGNMSLGELYQMANTDAEEISVSRFSVSPGGNYVRSISEDGFIKLGDSPDNTAETNHSFRPPAYESIYARGDPQNGENLANGLHEHSGPPPMYSSRADAPHDKNVQEEALEILRGIVLEGSVLGKLKQITKCYRFVGNQVSHLKTSNTQDQDLVCCDELLTVLIVLLTNMEKFAFQQLYAHMRMVIDLLPQFMIGSVHDCSLTNLHAAFQYLSDRVVIQQTRESSEVGHFDS